MIRIEIDGTTDPRELNAIAALIGALGGRALAAVTTASLAPRALPDAPAATTGADLPPPPPLAEPTSIPESERLLLATAASVTTPPAEDDGADNPNAPATDRRGYPWDERIHASTKALNNDGTWRNKRGVDKALLAQIEAEMAAAVGVAAGAGGGEPTLQERMAAVAAASAVPPPPAPAADAPPPPPAGDTPISAHTFASILKRAEAKNMTYDDMHALAQRVGLPKIGELVKNPELFDTVVELIDDHKPAAAWSGWGAAVW